ncbi:MAG TPA: DsbA family protein [Solirubrobacterales bacterium]|jgi:protein-disulfide isomerase
MSDLTSSAIPQVGTDDHVRGTGEEGIVVYADLGCPLCAAEWQRLRERRGRLVFRHFPVAGKHPRSPVLHAAAEAAGRQGGFFEMVDSLYGERGRVDDPHLWERVERLGLDLQRFEADRRAEEVQARVRRDFESGIRAGVNGTPAIFDERGERVG